MLAPDGKMRLTDELILNSFLDLFNLFRRLKRSLLSFGLAQIASERLDGMQAPELSIDRALDQYIRLGYSESWINKRLKSIEIRKELTDEWKSRGVRQGQQFTTLADVITKTWSGKTTKEYKKAVAKVQ
jgi:hypothetical protein